METTNAMIFIAYDMHTCSIYFCIYSCICACVKQVSTWIKREWRYRMSIGRKRKSSIFFEMHLSKGHLFHIKIICLKFKKRTSANIFIHFLTRKLSPFIYKGVTLKNYLRSNLV